MTQLAPVAACALTAPEMASAASSASVYLSRPSLESFDGVTIALRCTLSDTSRVGSGGVVGVASGHGTLTLLRAAAGHDAKQRRGRGQAGQSLAELPIALRAPPRTLL